MERPYSEVKAKKKRTKEKRERKKYRGERFDRIIKKKTGKKMKAREVVVTCEKWIRKKKENEN